MPRTPDKFNTRLDVSKAMGVKTGKSVAKLSNSGELRPSNCASTPNVLERFRCECGRGYALKSSLARHLKECGKRDTTRCQWCGATFATYAGVRQHERRAHPQEYQEELQAQLSAPESELMTKIADIEAKSSNGVFFKEMMAATGLTHQQVRYRREKPEYRSYLERARAALARPIEVSPLAASTGAIPKKVSTQKATKETASRPRQSNSPCTSVSARTRLGQASSKTIAGPPKAKAAGKRVIMTSPKIGKSSSGKQIPVSTGPPPHGAKSSQTPPRPPRPVGSKREPRKQLKDILEISNLSNLKSGTPPEHPVTPVEVLREEQFSQREELDRESRTPTPEPVPTPSANTSAAPLSPLVTEDREMLATFLRKQIGPHSSDGPLIELVNAALEVDDQHLLVVVDNWLNSLSERKPKQRQRRAKKKPVRHYGQTNTGSSPRASRYKNYQDFFAKNRRGLAEMILTGREGTGPEAVPSITSVENLYGGIYESPSPPDDEPFIPKNRETSTGLPFISQDEIRVAKAGWSISAPGMDQIPVATVKTMSEVELAVLFNIVLFRNVQPTSWRALRTTLVPKEGDLTDPANWRPITIGSAVQRLLHRVLASRLSKLASMSSSQRGFTEIDGTLANAMILHEYLRFRTLKGKGYHVISLDVRKAFDTVSHCSISRALDRLGIPETLAKYIMATFDATTSIKVGTATTRPIGICRGVRQGDPISPVLFNICLDEILEKVNEKYQGGSLPNGGRCAIMAFADDLILIADHDVEIPLMLDDVAAFLERRGMAVNPAKCRALIAGVVSGRSVARNRSSYTMNGTPIPNVDAFNAFRYLGHEFGHKGVERPNLCNLTVWLDNIRKSPLKPDQKLSLIRLYVIPRLLYGLQNPKITSKTLRAGDRLIRKTVKYICHLNVHTPDALIHASVRDGGLGVMELRKAVPRIFLGRLNTLLEKEDDRVLQAVLHSDRVRLLMATLSNMAGDVPESTFWRARIASGDLSKGVQQASDDSSSRLWISDKPAGWSGRDYVRAVQLRTGNLPTKAIPSVPVGERHCRNGCPVDESIAHVLQTCPLTHGSRIRRHDEVVKKVARHCRTSGWTVEEEPHLRSPCGQLFKPDLAVHQPDGVVVIADVQIAWDSEDLKIPYERKRAKYDVLPFHRAAKKLWPGKELLFAPIIVGARGIWPRINNDRSAVLKIPPVIRRNCVNSVLKWGSSIHAEFNRSVWAKRHNPRPAPENSAG